MGEKIKKFNLRDTLPACFRSKLQTPNYEPSSGYAMSASRHRMLFRRVSSNAIGAVPKVRLGLAPGFTTPHGIKVPALLPCSTDCSPHLWPASSLPI